MGGCCSRSRGTGRRSRSPSSCPLAAAQEKERAQAERLSAALEKERAQAERYAVAEERARIARELHDLVGHAIATITVQAGAERMALGGGRTQTSQVLGQIELTGRQTLQEMRRLLGALRDPDDTVDLAPQPGLARLDDLAEWMARSGLAVAVRVTRRSRRGASGCRHLDIPDRLGGADQRP